MFFRYKHSSLLCKGLKARRVLYVEYRYDECRGNLVKRSSLFFPEHQRQKRSLTTLRLVRLSGTTFFLRCYAEFPLRSVYTYDKSSRSFIPL